MGEVIWVEVLSRHRDIGARYRCEGPEVRIGRGYDNDVVIDDPYVAIQHLCVRRDEAGALIAEDLGSVNGTFLERGRKRLQRIVLDGERAVRIGQTLLRIRSASHAVPRERIQASRIPSWPLPLALAAVILGLEMLIRWLNQTAEAKPYSYVLSALTVALLVVGWTAVWSVLARVFSGHSRFERNLVVALSGLLIYLLLHQLLQLGAFALSWQALQTYQYAVAWSLLAAVVFLHLRAIGSSHTWLKGGIVAALLAIVLGTQYLTQTELRSGNSQQDYVRRLMPPALRLAPLHGEDAFFAEAADLKPGLDRDRKEDASASGIGFLLDGED